VALKTVLTFDDFSPHTIRIPLLEQLLELFRSTGVKGTLFTIPYRLLDHVTAQKYVEHLVDAKATGQEIGLHGFSHVKNEFGFAVPIPYPSLRVQCALLEKGRECLRKTLGESPLGFRAPDYRHSRITLQALQRLGFRYDSSKTVFKPTSAMRFRFRTGFAPKPIKMAGLYEIPVTADYTINLNHDCFARRLARAVGDFNWVRKSRGVFVVNTHLQVAGQLGIEFLRQLINELRGETEFVRLIDLA
jgi:peptidoglycan/xylan/chitin deacetylase (PgdA/CDA1 family)